MDLPLPFQVVRAPGIHSNLYGTCKGVSFDQATILAIQYLITQGDLTGARALLSKALANELRNGGLYDLRGVVNVQEKSGG